MRSKKYELKFYEPEKKIDREFLKSAAEIVVMTVITALLSYVITYSFGLRTTVIGDSMEPALINGQEVLVDRFIYLWKTPGYGDVIAFRPNGNENAHLYIKRVVALPGDTVVIRDGVLYVNGSAEEDTGNGELIEDSGIASLEITLNGNEYFVLGDARNNSEDSRSGNIGPVERKTITGKAWLKLGKGENSWGLVK
ncbi:MAG: signal peptidase I [Lachnospiraceae bacterium]|nr:signal peptidase I [Lachnospiraceae bacterium]